MNDDIHKHFDALDKWAVEKLNGEQEPPWVWYELMKLRESIERLRNVSVLRINMPPEIKVMKEKPPNNEG